MESFKIGKAAAGRSDKVRGFPRASVAEAKFSSGSGFLRDEAFLAEGFWELCGAVRVELGEFEVRCLGFYGLKGIFTRDCPNRSSDFFERPMGFMESLSSNFA